MSEMTTSESFGSLK